MEIVTGLIVLAVSGLVAWIYGQSNKITRLETNSENQELKVREMQSEISSLKSSMYGIDNRLDKRVVDITKEFSELINRLNITLEKLNVTMSFLQEDVKELKKNKD